MARQPIRRRRVAPGGSPTARHKGPAFEPLETRLMLAAGPLLISEMMAVNSSTLADGDGDYSDWVEIYNPTESPVSLSGWCLTDDAADLAKWQFPAVAIPAGNYLVVFASGKAADPPPGELHTNFALDGAGEYLGLVRDDGAVAYELAPQYPEQLEDVSYGLGNMDEIREELVSSGAGLSYHLPTPGDDLLAWTAADFDDSQWIDTFGVDQAGLLITEVDTGETDWIEIQNVSDAAVDTAGWFVAVNDGSSGDPGAVNPTVWPLSGPIAAGEVRYRTDDPADNYFGGDLSWDFGGPGWAMIVNGTGQVVDFLAWGYSQAQIASIDVSVGGFDHVTVGDRWNGDGAPLPAGGKGSTIVVVSDAAAYGAGDRDDPLVEYLQSLGHSVDTIGMGGAYRENLAPFSDPVKLAALENADLVVVSRRTSSGSYDNDTQQWNQLATPLILMSGYLSRSSRWGWTAGGSSNAALAEDSMPIAGGQQGHPFVAGQTSPVRMYDWSPGNQAPKGIYLPTAGSLRPGTTEVGSLDGLPYLLDIPAGTNLGGDFGTTGARRAFMGHWGYDTGTYRFDDFVTAGFRDVLENTVGELMGTPTVRTALRRTGDRDNDDAGDLGWVSVPSRGTENPGLTVPFGEVVAATTGLGFSADQPQFESIIRTDVGQTMQGQNASMWTRVEFQVADLPPVGVLTLRMKYDDGFAAYLNGVEIARRNAPGVLAYDSAATAEQPDSQAVVFEDIDVSQHIVDTLQTGANVLAVHGLNLDAGDADFLVLPELIAGNTLEDPLYMVAPTPGLENAAGTLGFVRDTRFSVDRGFYTQPFTVEITSNTLGAEIRYTLDGSRPTATTGTVYAGPITVNTTTTLRAAAFKAGYVATNVDTQSYIFPEHVLSQTRPPGYPTSWGSAPAADYDVDPEIVNNPQYHDQLLDGLTAIPSLSVVLPVADIFGGGGLYSNPGSSTMEKAASAEWIYPDGSDGFQVDAGMKMQGGASRNPNKAPKHSMSLRFRAVYGEGRLDFPMFGEDPLSGEDQVDRFNSLHLRAMYNNSWIHWDSGQRRRGSMIRDQWVRDSLLAMGQSDAGEGTYAHLYLNGLYWGVYNVHERQEASHYAEHNGGDEDRIDGLNSGSPVDGNTSSWNSLQSMVAGAVSGGISVAEFDQIKQRLDVVSLIDYMIVNHYGGNADWDGHNWRAAGGGADNAPWKIYSWDAERILEGNSTNRTGVNSSGCPSRLYQNLRNSPEFRIMFADRLHRHFFNGGAMMPEATAARWMDRANELDLAIVGESARWGDYRRDVHSSSNGPYEFYTKNGHWLPEQQRLTGSHFPVRSGVVMNQYGSAGMYPNTDAPEFYINGSRRHGGLISSTDALRMPAAAGTVYYTLDGSDPRLPGGGISDDAVVFDGSAITLSASSVVKARARNGGEWSALCEAPFYVDSQATAENLVISELNYHPYDPTPEELAVNPALTPDDFEFVELRNTGSQPVDLTGVRVIDGVEFDFAGQAVTALAPNDHVLIAANPAALQLRYGPGLSIAGQFQRKLNNDGEQITVLDYNGSVIVDFSYDEDNGWPGRAAGKGASLELIDPAAVPHTAAERALFLDDDDNWRSSSEYGGSPGAPGSGPLGDVLVNEVLTHTDPPQLDAIELINTTAAAVELGGWYLSDSWGWESSVENGNYKKYRIPPGTTIPPGGYTIFDEDDFNPTPDDRGPYDFALDGARGDDVWLMEADGAGRLRRFVDHVEFGAAANGKSWGRWPNGAGDMYPMIEPTIDKAHPENGQNSGPRVGPVVLSELHYNPKLLEPDAELEFVEIYNPTPGTIDLTDWRISGIDYDFPPLAELSPYATLVVLPLDPRDPADATKWTAFCAEYSLDPTAKEGFLGGYNGRLDDGGELVRLLRPDGEPEGQPGLIPQLLEDQVRYDDQPPWPAEPDGGGSSLRRIATDAWGPMPSSWESAAPSPGTTHFLPDPPAVVVARHVFYNGSSFDGADPAPGAADDGAIAPDKVALLPGGTATKANYTGFSSGLNGIIIDVDGLPEPAAPAAEDFDFRVGNDAMPDGWPAAPTPVSITVRPGEGLDGSDRVTLIWADNAIAKQWLRVTVLATAETGLDAPDVFYFGNAIGEAGNSTSDAKVNTIDMLGARDNQRNILNPAPIDFAYDYNRDRRVNSSDMLIARNNQTHFLNALQLITVPPPGGKAVDHLAAAGQSAPQESLPARLSWLYEFETEPEERDGSESEKQQGSDFAVR